MTVFMKLPFFTFILCCLIAFYSCEEEAVEVEKTIPEPPNVPQLINWSAMNSQGWKNMSFPNWFSKTLIDSNKIERVSIEFTNLNMTDSLFHITDTMPNRLIDVDFDTKGNVKKVFITEFIDGVKLTEHIFSYKNEIDSIGYSAPAVSSNVKYRKKSMISFLNTIQELQQYERLVVEENKDTSVLKFIDMSSNDKIEHYFLLDSSFWNVSYIDHHFEAKGENLFYYGAPQTYTSSFKLENLVEKTMKQSKNYYNNGALKNQSFYDNDFITKRSFFYDSVGIVKQFTDSLTSGENYFLHSENGFVSYNKNLPMEINYHPAEDSLLNSPIKKVKFIFKHENSE
ncbi:hypothetical protein [Brumimicrobium aurantiacum]|uniref:Uncharacterized protein n=1 Tax=Brumimicrobium aurantiacum TaxID=1737063 RepID=A0A3E1F270_9FLAO|nr:hypothetical protein [Brumimicrobium aurantiacum]RFC55916.1 hypothetical protein DXU93_02970 [Brumimicrobium aurantiacum]